ncbi:MAG TPA: ATP-binding cassette domain-containing protein, partial [Candidatus Binataceae bacterium]|nr:ATP-binding cassette domain-containing protein [Candidatus Binataceae bacterium]
RVLILDEPTSVLSAAELEPFLQLLRRLREQGRVVILVTHKLGEALAVADRLTVLRHGRRIAEREAALTNEVELATLMMGNAAPPRSASISSSKTAMPVVELQQVTVKAGDRLVLEEISLALKAGSIVGIAGVDGNGQVELVEVMAGTRRPASGRIRVDAGRRNLDSAVAVIPQNRDVDGLILDLSLWENLLLFRPLRSRLGVRYGWIQKSQTAQLCRELIDRFAVRGSGPRALARSLSGGNRQRFVVARALAAEPSALIAHDVCRGLDVAAAASLRIRLQEYAAQGGAVLLISTDLEELFELCDSLYVIYRGRLSQARSEPYDPLEIGLLMSGGTQ